MKKLTFRGKEVYTSEDVVNLCEINKSRLYGYVSGSSAFLVRGEDFITLKSISEKEEFYKENPDSGRFKSMISLYYDSAVDKIIDYREHLMNSSWSARACLNLNKNEEESFQLKEPEKPIVTSSSNQQINQEVLTATTYEENSEQFSKRRTLPNFNNSSQLEILSRLVIRLDEDNKNLNNRIFQLESELKEIRNSNLELTKLLQEYISLKNGC